MPVNITLKSDLTQTDPSRDPSSIELSPVSEIALANHQGSSAMASGCSTSPVGAGNQTHWTSMRMKVARLFKRKSEFELKKDLTQTDPGRDPGSIELSPVSDIAFANKQENSATGSGCSTHHPTILGEEEPCTGCSTSPVGADNQTHGTSMRTKVAGLFQKKSESQLEDDEEVCSGYNTSPVGAASQTHSTNMRMKVARLFKRKSESETKSPFNPTNLGDEEL